MKRIFKMALAISIIFSLVFMYSVVNIEPVFRDLGLKLPTITSLMTSYPYLFVAMLLIIPLSFELKCSDSGIPLSISIFTIFMISLVLPMFMGGCLHSIEFDLDSFIRFGFGVFPALILISVLSWFLFLRKKFSKP